MSETREYAICRKHPTLGWLPAMHTPPQFDTAPLIKALRGAIGNLRLASINADAFGGEDDPEYVASRDAWEADIATFEAALAQASPAASDEGGQT